MRIDVHQHFWTEPLIEALASRRELPFVRDEHGLTVLYTASERPYVLDLATETYERRAALVERDGVESALVCLSSPLGIESLPRAEATPLLDAYLEGALGLGEPFAVWGAVALDEPDAADVDRLLDRGCVGVSLPAGALADVDRIERLRPLLARLQTRGAPLLVHPGPGPGGASHAHAASFEDPIWWPALTRYVADMHAAWLAFLVAGRAAYPKLRVIFTMLAGLAPVHCERLTARGGPDPRLPDRLTFYETSSYGPRAIRSLAGLVGGGQLLYGSDRPVLEPGDPPAIAALGFDLRAGAATAAERVFGAVAANVRSQRGRDQRGRDQRGRDQRGRDQRGRRTPSVVSPDEAVRASAAGPIAEVLVP